MADRGQPGLGRGMMDYTVLIVDDHELFSTSLRMVLRGHGIEAHQVTPDSYEAILSYAATIVPGLVVLDLDLGKGADGQWLRGSHVVSALRESGWKVLIVSGGSPDQPSTAAAIVAGAIGAVPKSSSLDILLRTVVKAAAGQSVMTEVDYQKWLAHDRAYRAQERELAQKLGRLSRREREVLDLLVEGHRAAAIAERFVVSMTTVRTQISSILAKLEVNSQLEAVAIVRRKPQDRP